MICPSHPIAVMYGPQHNQSIQDMTRELLETVQLAAKIPAGSRIGIKPNLVVSAPAEDGATTHPEIVEGLISYLKSYDFNEISIIEGSWVGDSTQRAFKICGYEALSKTYQVELIDTQKDTFSQISADGFSLSVCNCMRDIDILINIPVLKGHCQTLFTGALKNLKGCIPDKEKRRFHSKGLHEPIAKLNTVLKQDFIIMDAICGDPTFEEGGSPSTMNRILFSEDPVQIDSYAMSLLHLEPAEVPYVIRSEELGVGKLWNRENGLLEINTPETTGDQHYEQDPIIRQLREKIIEKEACSSCYAALIQALKHIVQTQNSIRLDDYLFAIGRGYRDSGEKEFTESGKKIIAVGACTAGCTSGCADGIPGCPPTAESIAARILGQTSI